MRKVFKKSMSDRRSDSLSKLAAYTLIEVLFVLAISASGFVTMASLLRSNVRSTIFNQSIDDFESVMLDMINDTSTGVSLSKKANCSVSDINTGSNSTPLLTKATPTDQATNQDCVVLGHLIVPRKKDANTFSINITPIIARRTTFRSSTKFQIQNLDDAKLKVAEPLAGDDFESLTKTYDLKYGLKIKKILNYDQVSSTTNLYGAFATVMTLPEFGSTSDPGTILSGNSAISVFGISNTTLDTSYTDIIKTANRSTTTDPPGSNNLVNRNPIGGIGICLEGNGSNKNAYMIIGEEGKNSKVQVFKSNQIYDERCS